MKTKARARRRPARRRRKVRRESLFRDLIAANAHGAFRDESYAVTQRVVEELLKDPELRQRIDDVARALQKRLAAKD